MKFCKKPVVIEAIRYTGENITDIWDEFGAGSIYGPVEHDPCAYILTLEGRMTVQVGDWIIKGVQGEFYPCKPDIFEATYEDACGLGANGAEAMRAACIAAVEVSMKVNGWDETTIACTVAALREVQP